MAFTIVDGAVALKTTAVSAEGTLSSVGTSGTTATISIGNKIGRITRMVIRRTVGAANENYTVQIYDRSAKTANSLIFSADVTEQDRMDYSPEGVLLWNNTGAAEIYLVITTATTNGHTFSYRIDGIKG